MAQKLRIVGSWLLQALLGVGFVTIGVAKFADPAWVRNFERWGYPPGFHLVTGVLEIAGALALFVPRTASYGAIALSLVMVAASVTHASAGQPWTRPLPHLTLLMVLALLRWRDRWRPSPAPPAERISPARS